MTKKHFIELADKLRPTYQSGKLSTEALGAIVSFCHDQNKNFMEARWMGYLKNLNGPNGGKR